MAIIESAVADSMDPANKQNIVQNEEADAKSDKLRDRGINIVKK